MRIAIPDDYQDCVRTLDCFARLAGHEVRIFNDTVNATFAATRGLSLKFLVGVIVVGVFWYAASWALNKRRGVDLSLSYREIPPE